MIGLYFFFFYVNFVWCVKFCNRFCWVVKLVGDGEVVFVGILFCFYCNFMLGVEIYGLFFFCCICGVVIYGWKIV